MLQKYGYYVENFRFSEKYQGIYGLASDLLTDVSKTQRYDTLYRSFYNVFFIVHWEGLSLFYKGSVVRLVP